MTLIDTPGSSNKVWLYHLHPIASEDQHATRYLRAHGCLQLRLWARKRIQKSEMHDYKRLRERKDLVDKYGQPTEEQLAQYNKLNVKDDRSGAVVLGAYAATGGGGI